METNPPVTPPAPAYPTYSQAYQAIPQTNPPSNFPLPWKVIFKLSYIIGFTAFLVFASLGTVRWLTAQNQTEKTSTKGPVVLENDYQNARWQGFGEVFEPKIKVPVYFPVKGYTNQDFLLDSGAVVSSLPREKAEELGFTLSQLPRSTFAGFGGTTSFAYKADLKVLMGEKEVTIPVVFSEAGGTKPILGRSGFFENYSVFFNSKDRKIEVY